MLRTLFATCTTLLMTGMTLAAPSTALEPGYEPDPIATAYGATFSYDNEEAREAFDEARLDAADRFSTDEAADIIAALDDLQGYLSTSIDPASDWELYGEDLAGPVGSVLCIESYDSSESMPTPVDIQRDEMGYLIGIGMKYDYSAEDNMWTVHYIYVVYLRDIC